MYSVEYGRLGIKTTRKPKSDSAAAIVQSAEFAFGFLVRMLRSSYH